MRKKHYSSGDRAIFDDEKASVVKDWDAEAKDGTDTVFIRCDSGREAVVNRNRLKEA